MDAAGVVSPRELAVAMMRLGADTMRAQMLADPSLARRHGFSVVSRGRLTCFASREIGAGVFNHVSGYGTYASATQGFGGDGPIANVFERAWTIQLRKGRRATAFIGRLNGRPAATGVLYRGGSLAALYSGSVLQRFRGRGFQNAMIAARLAYGWE